MSNVIGMNQVGSIAKYIFGEVLWDFVYAPVWWYSRGFLRLLVSCKKMLVAFEHDVGLGMWLKVFWKPMYGQHDITGKAVSFFMRLVVLVYRLVRILVYLVFLLVLIALWLAAPIVVVWQLVAQFVELLIR